MGEKINWRGIWFWVAALVIRLPFFVLLTGSGSTGLSPETEMFLVNIVLNAVVAVLIILGLVFLLKDNWKK